MAYKSIDLFAGIGGIRLGFEEGMVDSILASEHEDLSDLERFDPNEAW